MISCYYRYPAKCARANEKIAIFGERYTHKNRQHTQRNGSPCLKAVAIKLCMSGILFRKIRGLKGNMSLKNMSRTEVVLWKVALPYKMCVWGWGRGRGTGRGRGERGGEGAHEYGVGLGIYIPNLFKGVLFYYPTVKADLCKRYVFACSRWRNGWNVWASSHLFSFLFSTK